MNDDADLPSANDDERTEDALAMLAEVVAEVTVTHDDDGPKPIWPKIVILQMRGDGTVTWRWPGE